MRARNSSESYHAPYQVSHTGQTHRSRRVTSDRDDGEVFLLSRTSFAGNPAILGVALRPEALRPHLTVGMLNKDSSQAIEIRYLKKNTTRRLRATCRVRATFACLNISLRGRA